MNRIKVLPDSVKRMIAAGEVVEGPLSVIKELMENSIDADSTEIDVEVLDSGFKKIVIRDNGIGIYREDLPLVIVDHATSRISDITDIDRITSFGFRGEAISSISSISKLTIITRSRDEGVGSKFVSFNDNTDVSDYAGVSGTSIIVENLFYNTPARKKFLKSKSAELRKIKEIFLRIAFSAPEISFSFTVDGKRQITLNSVKTIDERLSQIYGKEIRKNLYFDKLQDFKVDISAYFSKPHFLKSSRSMQLLYVNNRVVEYKFLGFLLSKSYEGIAQKGKHPVAFIFLKIDPQLVDVNIHPAKREVKFFDQRYIDSLINNLLKKVLGNRIHRIRPNYPIEGHITHGGQDDTQSYGSRVSQNPATLAVEDNVTPPTGSIERNEGNVLANDKDYEQSFPESDYSLKSIISNMAGLYKGIERVKQKDEIKLLGVIFDTYILIEEGEAIDIIDFHAAHERFIYDAIINKKMIFETQSLIFPQVIELSIEDYQIVIEKMDFFLQIAFDIDSFSDSSIIVRGIPTILEGMDIEGFYSDVIESIKMDSDFVKDIRKVIAEKVACHSSKRSGDMLSIDDAREIASKALKGDYELRCPHGRPYIYKLEKKDLEKMFKRL